LAFQFRISGMGVEDTSTSWFIRKRPLRDTGAPDRPRLNPHFRGKVILGVDGVRKTGRYFAASAGNLWECGKEYAAWPQPRGPGRFGRESFPNPEEPESTVPHGILQCAQSCESRSPRRERFLPALRVLQPSCRPHRQHYYDFAADSVWAECEFLTGC